jgi:hypothetical protein
LTGSGAIHSLATSDPPGILRFALHGDISHAGHFVRANWPREHTKPVFDAKARLMTLSFELTSDTVRDLQDTLTRAMTLDGPLAKSARAFRMLLSTKLAGKVIPDGASAMKNKSAG